MFHFCTCVALWKCNIDKDVKEIAEFSGLEESFTVIRLIKFVCLF